MLMMRPRQSVLFALLLLAGLFTASVSAVRVVSKDELATKTSETGDVIWLSIMGEVYDVSNGTEYYAEGNGYSIFAGRDASVSFITGRFTPEEAEKSVEELKPEELGSLDHWREFYEKEEKYSFVGLLEGELYDKDGNPTDLQKKLMVTVKKEKAKMEEKQKEREARIAARRKKREAEVDAELKEL